MATKNAPRPVAGAGHELTVDQLARRVGTTTRNIRAFQTRGLLPHPRLRGRTGLYGPEHLDRLQAVLRLQRAGFSLAALTALFAASTRGLTVARFLEEAAADGGRSDAASVRGDDLGAFEDWPLRRSKPALAVVPTTVVDLRAS